MADRRGTVIDSVCSVLGYGLLVNLVGLSFPDHDSFRPIHHSIA